MTLVVIVHEETAWEFLLGDFKLIEEAHIPGEEKDQD
jgi:hypothetical protein